MTVPELGPEQALEDALRSLAARGTDDPTRVHAVLAKGRRARRRRRAASLGACATAVATTAVLAGTLFLQAGGTATVAPAAGQAAPGLGWEPRGAYAEDSSFGQQAAAVWDRSASVVPDAPPGAHTDVGVLFADFSPIVGPVAVLEGTDAAGARRLAVLTGPYRHAGQPTPPAAEAVSELVLRDDRPAPPGDTTQVSLLTRRLPTTASYAVDPYAESPTTLDGVLGLVLARPGAVVDGFTSTAFDSYSGGGGSPDSAWGVAVLPPSATLTNVTVTVRSDGDTVYSGPPDRTGLADPAAPPGRTVEDLAVNYLPPGFRPVPDQRTEDSSPPRTTHTYRGPDGTEIQIASSGGRGLGAAAPGQATPAPAGAETSPTTTHDGKQALLTTRPDGTDTISWQEAPGLTIEITGPHSLQIELYQIGHALSRT